MSVLNPRVDFAFKKLFGSVENKDILISFINAVVSKADQVIDVTLLNPYNNKDHKSDKLSILDIKATDEKGQHYNIEMQITDQVYYNQRALYYWSRLYTSQLQEGDVYSDLKKTISINVLNFDYFDDEPHYHNVFKVLHVESHKSYFEDLELHFVELHKFNDDVNPIKTTLDRWVKFLKKAHHYDKTSFPDELKAEPAIEKAFYSLNTLSMDKDEREIYEARLKWLRDEAATLQKAHEKGQIEGIEQGIEQGIELGIQKNRHATAIKQLKRGVAIDLVAEDTGLTCEEVAAIKMTMDE
ncbi:MAG: Rpn family recombination-promoting nuclease/putative transposase [Legionellales bacterium]